MQKASDRADHTSVCNPTYTWQEIPDDPPLPGHDSDEGIKETSQQERGLGMQKSHGEKIIIKKGTEVRFWIVKLFRELIHLISASFF